MVESEFCAQKTGEKITFLVTDTNYRFFTQFWEQVFPHCNNIGQSELNGLYKHWQVCKAVSKSPNTASNPHLLR